MSAGSDVICNDVVRKVEIEEKRVAGLDTNDLNQVGDVAAVDDNVGGNGSGKEDTDDSSYVFVSGGIEVSAADPDDTGGVNVAEIVAKSDSLDEIEQFKKEELGTENGGITVDPAVLETNGVVHESVIATDDEVKAVNNDVDLENGSTVDSYVVLETDVIVEGVNGLLDKFTGEDGEIVKSTEEGQDANGIANGEVKTDEIVSKATFDSESTLNPIESSEIESTIKPQVTVTESVSTPDVIYTTDELLSTPNPLRNTDCEVMVHNGPESVSTVIDKAGCEVTVDGSDKPSEDLECQVTANGPEYPGSPIKEHGDQVIVDESGKPFEDLESQVTADGLESCESPIMEQECKVSAGGLESTGSLVDDQECPVSVDESEPSGNHTEEVDSNTIVKGTDEKSEEHQELLLMNSKVNIEAKPNNVCNGIKEEHRSESLPTPYPAENKKAERTEIGLGTESEDNPDSGLVFSEDADALANGQVERFDENFQTGEHQVSRTEADESVLFEKAKLEEILEKSVSVDESEPIGNYTEEVDFNTIVKGADEKSEEHQELLIMNSEVNIEAKPNNACNGIKDEHQSELASTPYPAENKKAERTEIGSGTDSGLVFFKDADALANVQIEKFDEILQTGEHQVSGTEADESVPFEKAKLEEILETQMEVSSETLIKSTESVETVENIEEMKEQVKIDDEIQESQIVVTDIVQDNLNLEDNTAESTNEAEAPLEVETNIELVTHENTASQYEVSNGIDKPEEGFQPEGSAENVEFLPSIDHVSLECKNGDLLVEKDNGSHSNLDDLTVVKQEVESETNLVTENISAEDIWCKTGIENVDVPDDEEKKNEVKDTPVEFVAHMVTENIAAEVTNCGTEIENVDVPDDEENETEVKDAPIGEHSTLSFPESYVNPGAVIEFGSIGRHETTSNIHNDDDDLISVPVVANENAKPSWGEESENLEQNVDGSHGERSSDKMFCPEVEDIDGTQSEEIPTSSVESSVSDAMDVQNEETEVLAYNFLIRIPRFEDESFRDQIRSAQLLLEEKTSIRDAIRVDIQGKRARLRAHNETYNAAKLEETAARRLVRLKRQEIESVQIVINRWKNAMSVEDIDVRIFHTEHVIQHETLDLKDEKQFIREIKQLKTLRGQLASNMGTKEEIRQAIDQKDQNEERMKILRKELDSLKDKVSKAEAVVKAVGKKYDEESRKERELQAQFRVADDVRQKAYAHLNSLKKLSYDKNKKFRMYKEDTMAARDFVSRGDKDALHRLCANQVEAFMEQWNNDDEFRKEYVSRCIMNANRRQKAFEGSSLVSDDAALVLPCNDNEGVDRSLVSIPVEVKTVSVFSACEEGKIVSSTENKHVDINNKSIENLSGQKNQTLKTKGPAKPTLGSDVAMVTEPTVVTETTNKKEEENTVTKEGIVLAKKDEELKKEEIEAKLKEQRRLEEKAKALEALERKKRNAEKAQLKAELRARKEAEQKEKEREKRLRKKEKKKAGGGNGSINGEEAVSSESSNETTTKEIEPVKENIKKKTQKPPAHFFSKQLKPKPIPPPLVNRNKKRWQQYGKLVLAAVAILALFLVGNTVLFTNLKGTKSSGPI